MKRKSEKKRHAPLEPTYVPFGVRAFGKTPVSEISRWAGNPRATICADRSSTEQLFVEYAASRVEIFEIDQREFFAMPKNPSDDLPGLEALGDSFIRQTCSPERILLRRLMIAEAERSSIGRSFPQQTRAHAGSGRPVHLRSDENQPDVPEAPTPPVVAMAYGPTSPR